MGGKSAAKVTRPKRGTITKQVILDTSAVMFYEKGYDRTSLEDIASALSITKPSLYYHFTNKEEILLECITTANRNLMEDIARHDDVLLSGRKRVELFLRLYLDVISHDLGVSMVLSDDRVMSPEGREKYHGYRRVMNQALEDRLSAGVKDGSIVFPETRYAAYAIFGMFNWVAHRHLGSKAVDLDALFDRFVSIIFDGIGAK